MFITVRVHRMERQGVEFTPCRSIVVRTAPGCECTTSSVRAPVRTMNCIVTTRWAMKRTVDIGCAHRMPGVLHSPPEAAQAREPPRVRPATGKLP
ncbi:hypothetical protein [Streptomyces sp. SD31]|uniref:hypothetical protein n=1 Tax=Streptomyces sp. SD31 TaxID=3452208 RepID=UPI003F8A1BCC